MKKYLSNSKIGKQPEEVLKVHLGEKVVKENNLADKSVSVNKLADDVALAIEGVEQAGLLVSQELGDSEVIGISQRKITDEIEDIRNTLQETEENLEAVIEEKQDMLTFDETPTSSSLNPVTSRGINTALDGKADKSNTYTKAEVNNMIADAEIERTVTVVMTEDAWEALSSYNLYTIYRVQGSTSYADYMSNDGVTAIKLAEYDNAIDDEPIENSENLVKSGGIYPIKESLDETKIDVYGGTRYNDLDGKSLVSPTGHFIKVDLTTGNLSRASSDQYYEWRFSNKGYSHIKAYVREYLSQPTAYGVAAIAFYNSTDGYYTTDECKVLARAGFRWYEADVPSDATLIVVTARFSSASTELNTAQIILTQPENINGVVNDTKALKGINPAKDALGNVTTITGCSIDESGTIVEATGSSSSNYMVSFFPTKLFAGDIVLFTATSSVLRAYRTMYITTDPATLVDNDEFIGAQGTILNYVTKTGDFNEELKMPEDGWLLVYSYIDDKWSNRNFVYFPHSVVGDKLWQLKDDIKDIETLTENHESRLDVIEETNSINLSSQEITPSEIAEIESYYLDRPAEPTIEHYNSYLEEKIQSIPDGKHFIFITDTHWRYAPKKAPKLIQYIRKRTGIASVVFGGDCVHRPANKDVSAENGSYYTVCEAVKYINENLDYNVPSSREFNIFGTISQIDDIDITLGTATYYITWSTSTSTATMKVVQGLFLKDKDEGQPFTSISDIVIGDEVLVRGKVIKIEGELSEIMPNNYIYCLNGKAPGCNRWDINTARYHTPQETALRARLELSKFCTPMKERFGDNFIFCTGNHDLGLANLSGFSAEDKAIARIPYQTLISEAHTAIKRKAVYDEQGIADLAVVDLTDEQKAEMIAYLKQCYYVDDPVQKLRYIVTYTGQGASFEGIVEEVFGIAGSHCINTQVKFIAKALQTLPIGYDVIIVGHWIYYKGEHKLQCDPTLTVLVKEFKTKGSYTANRGVGNATFKRWRSASPTTFSFANARDARVLIIQGHHHGGGNCIVTQGATYQDAVVTEGIDWTVYPYSEDENIRKTQILIVVGHSAGEYWRTEQGVLTPHPIPAGVTPTGGTIDTDTVFDIVTITDDSRVVCTRIGYGSDRYYALPEVSPEDWGGNDDDDSEDDGDIDNS